MKRVLTACLVSLLFAAPHAIAADTRVELSFQDLVNSPQAKAAGIDGSVRFYLAGQSHPAVVTKFGEGVSNKKTNGVGKDDAYGCKWAALSALIAFQESAKQKGANAVVDLHSFYKRNTVKNPVTYQCHAGNIVMGANIAGFRKVAEAMLALGL